jgi:hypothetical protein
LIADEKTVTRRIENGRTLLSELASRQDWFLKYMKKTLVEPAVFENQKSGIWPNELTLYRSLDRSFLVLAYIPKSHLGGTADQPMCITCFFCLASPTGFEPVLPA